MFEHTDPSDAQFDAEQFEAMGELNDGLEAYIQFAARYRITAREIERRLIKLVETFDIERIVADVREKLDEVGE